MVEVFKTNVYSQDQAEELLAGLQKLLPDHKINFDLEDCDKVLRVENKFVLRDHILVFMQQRGVVCESLD